MPRRQEPVQVKSVLSSAARPSSILSALTGSVCRRVALVVFLAVVVLDVVVAVPVYLRHTDAIRVSIR
jgi:hypothetical protein